MRQRQRRQRAALAFRRRGHDDPTAGFALADVQCPGEIAERLAEAAIPLMVDGERSEGASALTFSLDTFDCDLLGPADGR